MWHLVIRKHSGEYVREQQEDKPAVHEIKYWEDFHSQYIQKSNANYYDSGVNIPAVVVNIFESDV